jgi:hypothetical protein
MTKSIFNIKSTKKPRQHLRNNMTEPEIIIWSYLKNSQSAATAIYEKAIDISKAI